MSNSKNDEKITFRKVAIETTAGKIEKLVRAELSNKEIAEKLGLSESAVRSIRYQKKI